MVILNFKAIKRLYASPRTKKCGPTLNTFGVLYYKRARDGLCFSGTKLGGKHKKIIWSSRCLSLSTYYSLHSSSLNKTVCVILCS